MREGQRLNCKDHKPMIMIISHCFVVTVVDSNLSTRLAHFSYCDSDIVKALVGLVKLSPSYSVTTFGKVNSKPMYSLLNLANSHMSQ